MKTRVLHAEDDPVVRAVIGRILTREGWHVTAVADGAAALRKVREESFDVVITDHDMPEKNGLDLVAALRRDHFGGRIFVLSGALPAAARAEYRQLEVDGIAAKPITIAALNLLLLGGESGPGPGVWQRQALSA